jgi:hypothetical protein
MELWELMIRESVRDTLARYNNGGDRLQIDTLAGCFTPDGVMDITGRGQPLVGRSQIERALGVTLGKPGQPAKAERTFVHHHVASTYFISVRPTEVETASYFAVHTPIGLDHWGRYRDSLVPGTGEDDGRWLFTRRRITTDGFAPGSLFAR